MVCSVCGNELPDNAAFCSSCGSPVKKDLFCVSCGAKIAEGSKFCISCGKPIKNLESSNKVNLSKKKQKTGFKSPIVENAINKLPNDVMSEKDKADVAEIINIHAIGAAATAAGSAWIPGVGATISAGACGVFIITMYTRVDKRLSRRVNKDLSNTLGSLIIGDIAASAGAWGIATALSFIPGIGSISASVIMAGANYALISISGVIYLKMMASSKRKGVELSDLSEEELKKLMNEAMANEDIKSMMKDARDEYIKARKNGVVTGKETVELEEE